MKYAILFVVSLLLINVSGADTIKLDSLYQEYKEETNKLDSAWAQSYKEYFRHDSIIKVRYARSAEYPEAIACIIQKVDAEYALEREQKRQALLAKYKIKEAQTALAQLNNQKEINLASAY